MAFIKPPEDIFEFSGEDEMDFVIGATALSNPETNFSQRTARITSTGHGYQADSLIYLRGFSATLDFMNGMKKIEAVAANTIDVRLGNFDAYVAGTPAGTETGDPIVTYDVDWELMGFEFNLAADGGTSENFSIDVDAAKGAAWDTNLYEKDMNGIGDVVVNFSKPRPLKANDLIVFSYENTDANNLWGLKVIARRTA